jgi:hypothetical protein
MTPRSQLALVAALAAPSLALLSDAAARPVYAQATKKECGYCHLSSAGGGARGFRGRFYGANGLSFHGFDEKREAALARCEPDSREKAADAKVVYVQNATGPGGPHIQFMANQTPMIVIWVEPTIDPRLASAHRLLDSLATQLGLRAGIVGVIHADQAAALKATSDWASTMRILPDASGTAKKKFGATHVYDFALLKKGGDVARLWEGISKANIADLMSELRKIGLAVEPPSEEFPTEPVRGPKL